MTATSHAVIGTIIAAKVGNPALAIPLALASHVLADLFPHWDTGTNKNRVSHQTVFINSFFDVLISFVLTYLMGTFLFPTTNLWYIYFIVLISQSPDWIMAPYYFFKIKDFKWMYDLQKKFDNTLEAPWGIINQVGVLIFITVVAISL